MNIKEEISAQGVIVYHRTGSKDENNTLVLPPDGFRPEGYSFYGKGVYTSLSAQQMESKALATKYGPLLVESKVTTVEGFLSLLPDATKIIHRRDMTLAEQVAKIMSISIEAVQADPALSHELELLEEVARNEGSKSAGQSLRLVAPKIFGKLKGIITNDPEMGPSVIVFNPQTIIPVRYKVDGQGDWKNAGGNRDFYEKVKGFYQQKSMSYQEKNGAPEGTSETPQLPMDEIVRYMALMAYTNTQPSPAMKEIMNQYPAVKKAYYQSVQAKQGKTSQRQAAQEPVAA